MHYELQPSPSHTHNTHTHTSATTTSISESHGEITLLSPLDQSTPSLAHIYLIREAYLLTHPVTASCDWHCHITPFDCIV